MPKMTLVWLLIYCASLVRSFVDPVYGLVGYLFEYYLRPSLHWWGLPLPDLRWNMTISIVTAVTYFLNRASLSQQRTERNKALPFLLAIMLLMVVITPMAASMDRSWARVVLFSKIVAIYLLISQIVRTRKGFDTVVAMHIAGATWWGWEQYLDPRRDASRLANVGSADTLGDNLAAAHLLTVIPFIFVYLLTAKDKLLRALAVVATPLVVNLFILCNSRGGMLGLLFAGLCSFALAKRGHRTRLVAAAVLVGAVFWTLADPEFKARQQTTFDYGKEATAVERLESWQGGWNLIMDHPFGAGGEGYEVLSPAYITDIVNAHNGAERAPHNTYVLVLAEWGFPGMALYIAFIVATFVMLQRVRQRALPHDPGLFYRAFAIQVGLLGTMVAATFSDRFYGESFYWMCALAAALYRMPDEKVETVAVAVPERTPSPMSYWSTRPYRPANARMQ